MHTTPLRLFFALFATLMIFSAPAQADTGALYQASGMAQHQQHFQAALTAAQQRYGQQLPPALRETVMRNSSQRFELAGMHDRAQVRLALELDEQQMQQALSFFNSSLGKQVVAAETRASAPVSVARMQQGLPAMEMDAARRAVIERLSRQLPALEMGVEVSTALTGLAAQSANDLLGGLMTIPQQAGGGGRERLRQQMRPELPNTLAYIYRDLTDDQLTRYADWAESAAGQAFYRATERAVQDALHP
ncbi:MAG: DUF2059 domain-containing protein [Pseudomonas sp.]